MKKCVVLFSLLLAATAQAQQPTEKQKLEYELRNSPKVLVYGRLISDSDGDMIIVCATARHSHPTGTYLISDSRERTVHIKCDRVAFLKLALARGQYPPVLRDAETTVAFVGKEFGEYTYTAVSGAKKTVANIVLADAVPPNSRITPYDPSKPQSVARSGGSDQTPDLTLSRSW